MIESYQARVLEEKEELDKKITALDSLPLPLADIQVASAEEFSLLSIQLEAMKTYSLILHHRINTWESPY